MLVVVSFSWVAQAAPRQMGQIRLCQDDLMIGGGFGKTLARKRNPAGRDAFGWQRTWHRPLAGVVDSYR